jgi:hypothetical protein
MLLKTENMMYNFGNALFDCLLACEISGLYGVYCGIQSSGIWGKRGINGNVSFTVIIFFI